MNERRSVSRFIANLIHEWPAAGRRVRPAILCLYRTRDHLYEDLERVLRPHDLRPADMDVLVSLRATPSPHELTPTELYRALLMSSGGVTKILHRLQAARLVERPANPLDGRSQLVRLTAAGSARLDAAIEDVIEHERRFMAPLTPVEQAELGRLLDKLLAPLER
jgi:DNA-binding MarR family transcriptional regulator